MILGEVEETMTTTEIDEETDEEIVKKQTRKVGMMINSEGKRLKYPTTSTIRPNHKWLYT